MSTVHYTHCPVCGSASINPLLTVKDFSVSGEQFVIWQCGQCTLRFTQDVPDEQSIAPYYQSPDYISHSNTSKGLVNRLYQLVRNYTLERKARFVRAATGLSRGSILDYGAGIGAFLHTMKGQGWTASGLEPDPGARAQAAALFGLELGLPGQVTSLPRQSFDAITLWHVLEHVHRLHECMDQLASLLQDAGKIFIAVPNYRSLDSEVYKLYWAAYDVPRHLYHFTPKSMSFLAEAHGLQIVQTKRMWFDSFYISLLSSKYKNGNTNWIGAAAAGLRSNIRALRNKEACSSLVYVLEKKTQRAN